MRLRRRAKALWLVAICAVALGLGAAPAQGARARLSGEAIKSETVPGEGVEGACGVAVAGTTLYVSDYYRHRVDVFNSNTGNFSGQLAAPSSLNGVCGLAFGLGSLYANEWHESVVRLLPSFKAFDTGHESTGVAVDGAGNVYAVNRTYVAAYQPSGTPVLHEGQPLEIGHGALGDAYGIAVAAGRVYVADAASETVEVFEPSLDPDVPVTSIDHGFTSLRDGALAIDPTNGHLLVLDNLQPGYESPKAALEEFDSSGAFLGSITSPDGIVHGEPSGLAVDSSGNLFVTTGNSEGSNVIKFGPYFAAPPVTLISPGAASSSPAVTVSQVESPAASPNGRSAKRPQASASEVVQRGRVRVAVQAKLRPKKLPRSGTAPVRFSLQAKITSTDDSIPPQLRGIEIEINRNGHVDPSGLPVCRLEQIQPASTAGALEACRRSLVGEGQFSAKVLLTQQAPFPSFGKIVAFNGRWQGRPAILAHVFGTEPVPTSYTLPFVIGKVGGGTYGTALRASLPHFTSKWGYVTGISLSLGGVSRGYLSASCPAPKGFGGASFPLARASLSFGEGGPGKVDQTLTRSCGVR